MDLPPVVLVQKPASPLQPSLARVLSLTGVEILPGPDPAPEDLDQGVVVLWDVSGFAPGEALTLAGRLASRKLAVVLACQAMDEVVARVVRKSRALALLVGPADSRQVAAALAVAMAVHTRLSALTDELAGLRQQQQERQDIEKAKRVLMAAKGISGDEALARMQKQGRARRQKLIAVAQQLLAAHELFALPDDDQP